MNNSSELLLISLTDYFSSERNLSQMLTIVEGKSKFSLRLLDWFITNYCKNKKSPLDKKTNDIYHDYRAQLKAYKKIKFDPFRRRQRILFPYGDDRLLNTTIGQLNFFKWAIETKVLKYIYDNIDELERSMIDFQKIAKMSKSNDEAAFDESNDFAGDSSKLDKVAKDIETLFIHDEKKEMSSLVYFD